MPKVKSRILKVLILGEHAVGKTSLLNRYVTDEYSGEFKPTIGVDFGRKDLQIYGQNITMQIWDTAGQERFQALSTYRCDDGVPYYRGSDCCVLVYDCTDRASFNAIDSWRNEFLLHANPSTRMPFVLIANKIDLVDARQVTNGEAEEYIKSKGIKFYCETSAKDGTNVNSAFLSMAEEYVKELKNSPELNLPPSTVELKQTMKKRSFCF